MKVPMMKVPAPGSVPRPGATRPIVSGRIGCTPGDGLLRAKTEPGVRANPVLPNGFLRRDPRISREAPGPPGTVVAGCDVTCMIGGERALGRAVPEPGAGSGMHSLPGATLRGDTEASEGSAVAGWRPGQDCRPVGCRPSAGPGPCRTPHVIGISVRLSAGPGRPCFVPRPLMEGPDLPAAHERGDMQAPSCGSWLSGHVP